MTVSFQVWPGDRARPSRRRASRWVAASTAFRRMGACLGLAALSSVQAQTVPGSPAAAARPGLQTSPDVSAASSPSEPLRIQGVGDELAFFLERAVGWALDPGTRAPLAVFQATVRDAVAKHPEARLAREQRVTAEFATREALGAWWPQLSFTADGGRRSSDAVTRAGVTTPGFAENSQSLGLTARQLVYDFGATEGRVEARRSREFAAGARAQARRSELALRAVTAWHEVVRAREAVKLAEVNRAARQQILWLVEQREELGASARSDVLRARARLSDAQVVMVAANNRLRGVESVYREIFGLPAAPVIPLPVAPELDFGRYGDVAALVRRHPQYLEAAGARDAAEHEARVAAAVLRPSVHLEATALRRDLGGGNPSGLDTRLGLVLQQDLFSGGSDTARRDQARQRAAEANLELEALARQLERALDQTLGEVRNADGIVSARVDAVKVAQAAFDSVREQFAFRRGTLLDLLRAQEELFLAGRDLIDGIVDHALSRHRLLHLSVELNTLFGLEDPVAIPSPVSRPIGSP